MNSLSMYGPTPPPRAGICIANAASWSYKTGSEPALEREPSALLDNPDLLGRKLEELLYLEGRHLARQMPQTTYIPNAVIMRL